MVDAQEGAIIVFDHVANAKIAATECELNL